MGFRSGSARNILKKALERIPQIRAEFWENVFVPGEGENLNQELEKAGRVADFLEFAEMMCYDALDREESCGGHFRTEHQFTSQDPEVQQGVIASGEAKRHDDRFSYVSTWEHAGDNTAPILHKETLDFEFVKPSTRSYK